MVGVIHHVGLGLAVLALGAAALRMVSPAAPDGLVRVVAAAVTGVALAVGEALALGLVSLGGSAPVLVAAAVLTWAAAWRWLPRPEVSPRSELAAWWAERSLGERIAACTLAGAALAWLVWQLRHPSIGFDSSLYHYPFVAGWIDNGRPGTGLDMSYDIPYGSYPLTDEVAITWGAAISRSWVPLALWNPFLMLLLATAGWVTLRNLAVSRAAAGLATATLVTAPLMVRQLNEAQTDLPALAWLVCTAALVTSARRRPEALAVALLAAGLALGTKPSTGPMVVAVLAIGAWQARDRLRPLAPWLALGLGGAVVVGGVWYLRNIVEHGSPVWPFAVGPFGDPPPRFLGLVDQSFLQRPRTTLDGRLDEYFGRLGGTWLLLAASLPALAVGVFAPRMAGGARRALIVSSALALAGALVWSTAWGTGLPTSSELTFAEGFPISSLRYMLPALAAGALAVALATRARRPVRELAYALLAVALAWNLVESARLGTPWTPPPLTLIAGAVAGAAVFGLATLAASRLGRRPALPAWAAPVVAVLVVGVALTPAANGYVERWTHTENSSAYGPELVSWFVGRPDFEDGDGTIAIASRGLVAQLAGDHFDHPLELVPQHASCAEVRRLARRMPVVVTPTLFFRGTLGVEGYSAAACLKGVRPELDEDPFFVY